MRSYQEKKNKKCSMNEFYFTNLQGHRDETYEMYNKKKKIMEKSG